MNIRELLDEMKNKCLFNERKELIKELAREEVTDIYYSTYKDALLGDSLMNIKEYYNTQAWVLSRFFPIYTDEGNLDIEIATIEYDEDTSLEVNLLEEV